MTTIVTTTGNNFTTLVSDQGITSDLIHPDMPKIVQQGTWLIGVAGNARICDQLQYLVEYPEPPTDLIKRDQQDWFGWMVTKVIPLIDEVVKDIELDAELILVTHGKSFLISENLSVLSARPYWAIGSGAELALGVLAHSQYNPDWYKNHDLSARHALQVAGMHDPNTRGSIDVWFSYHDGKVFKG